MTATELDPIHMLADPGRERDGRPGATFLAGRPTSNAAPGDTTDTEIQPDTDQPGTEPSTCMTCGACCASYRVAFHWAETEAFLGGSTPAELTERIDLHRVAMRTIQSPGTPRCVALTGQIGQQVSCSIYGQRPSPCRELDPVWLPSGVTPSDQCNRARRRHGLEPLRLLALDNLPKLVSIAPSFNDKNVIDDGLIDLEPSDTPPPVA